jgi:hypothetical protein
MRRAWKFPCRHSRNAAERHRLTRPRNA